MLYVTEPSPSTTMPGPWLLASPSIPRMPTAIWAGEISTSPGPSVGRTLSTSTDCVYCWDSTPSTVTGTGPGTSCQPMTYGPRAAPMPSSTPGIHPPKPTSASITWRRMRIRRCSSFWLSKPPKPYTWSDADDPLKLVVAMVNSARVAGRPARRRSCRRPCCC